MGSDNNSLQVAALPQQNSAEVVDGPNATLVPTPDDSHQRLSAVAIIARVTADNSPPPASYAQGGGFNDLPPRQPRPPAWQPPTNDADWMTYAAEQAKRQQAAPPVPDEPPYQALGPRPMPAPLIASLAEAPTTPSGLVAGVASVPGIAAEVASGAGPGATAATRTSNVRGRLSERPADIRDAAQRLAEVVDRETDKLKASRPNDDTLPRYEAFISFLEMVADELRKLADALDRAIEAAAGPSLEQERVFLGTAAKIVDQLQAGFDEFLAEHRAGVAGFTVSVGLVAAATTFLHAMGVSPDVAAGIASGILTASNLSKK